MRIVAALGGNALLPRGEPLTAERQRSSVRMAARALLPVAGGHELVITHGNGPQVGLLALQSAAYKPGEPYPLDILGAETEGMIGYLIEQELANVLPRERRCAALLTQVEVDENDPAFLDPSKPIGPMYGGDEAKRMVETRGWQVKPDGDGFRRVVASPRPGRILELGVIKLLVEQGVIVICAGGGGIPVVRREDGSTIGVEAVIDKDRASAVLAKELDADALLLLTDVDAVYRDWDTPDARAIGRITPTEILKLPLEPGTMAPKVEAACDFVENTGGIAAIGRLTGVTGILDDSEGTRITLEK